VFTTAVKTTVVEALTQAFAQLASAPIDNSLELVPNNTTIEYPLEELEWPALFVQFRPTKVQWFGLNPESYTTAPGGIVISGATYSGITSQRNGFFEGDIDLQIMAMHSEERDRLYDSVTNLVLLGFGSPASNAFYNSITANTLVGLTTSPDHITPLGDSVSAGTPWSQEELTYEASVRIRCIGDIYEDKYDYLEPMITKITASGTVNPIVYIAASS